MALVGVELETLVSESDALTTRPPPCADFTLCFNAFLTVHVAPPAARGVKCSGSARIYGVRLK